MKQKQHRRAKTLMNYLDQFSRTWKHRENLNKIYNKKCKCEIAQQINFQQNLQQRDQQSNQHNTQYQLVKNAYCQKCNQRFLRHEKISQLHKSHFVSKKNAQQDQLYKMNKKLVEKLLKARTILKKGPQSPIKNNQMTANKVKSDIIRSNNCSSAINRRKQEKRVIQQNFQLQKRVNSAMNSSKYSQRICNTERRLKNQFSSNTVFNFAFQDNQKRQKINERIKQKSNKTVDLQNTYKGCNNKEQLNQTLVGQFGFIQKNKTSVLQIPKLKSKDWQNKKKASLIYFKNLHKLRQTKSRIAQYYTKPQVSLEQLKKRMIEIMPNQSSPQDVFLTKVF